MKSLFFLINSSTNQQDISKICFFNYFNRAQNVKKIPLLILMIFSVNNIASAAFLNTSYACPSNLTK